MSRAKGTDARARALRLTDLGTSLRVRLLKTRADILQEAVERVEALQRSAFEEAVTRILISLASDRAKLDHGVHFCDEEACGREDCPAERHLMASAP